MKIHILPVADFLQPDRQNFRAPHHNQDWGVEQDMLAWLRSGSISLVDNVADADYCYLPVFWNRCYINYGWGQERIDDIAGAIDYAVRNVDGWRVFTVCEWDVLSEQPRYNLHNGVVFCASRRSANTPAFDVPLLCTPHVYPAQRPRRQYLASFVGNAKNDGARAGVMDVFGGNDQFYLYDGDRGTRFFVDKMLESYAALCPRGYRGQSFRFYEAMNLGTVPVHIGDFDPRPFKPWIDWSGMSAYAETPTDALDLFSLYSKRKLSVMGEVARKAYNEQLRYGKWCIYVLKWLNVIGGKRAWQQYL